METGLSRIIDCEKVWKEDKLEQVVYLYGKTYKENYYYSSVREEERIIDLGKINKNTFAQFGFFLNGISEEELIIGEKSLNAGKFLNDFVLNQRGAMLQKDVSENTNEFQVVGGKQINRFIFNSDEKAFIKEDSILVQNIVAHIMNPKPHIKII